MSALRTLPVDPLGLWSVPLFGGSFESGVHALSIPPATQNHLPKPLITLCRTSARTTNDAPSRLVNPQPREEQDMSKPEDTSSETAPENKVRLVVPEFECSGRHDHATAWSNSD